MNDALMNQAKAFAEGMAAEPTVKEKPMDADEDFIQYMNVFSQMVLQNLHQAIAEKDGKKIQYYQGMMFALKSVADVYQTLLKIKGEYI